MILIVKTNKEKLHDLEFVKPIEQIVEKNFVSKHYSEIKKADLKKADKVIICGTSLKDHQFVKDIKMFEWIKNFERPILGICAGMQIIGLVFGQRLWSSKEIGATKVIFKKEFLGLEGKQEVYALHQMAVNFVGKDFMKFGESKKCVHAVKKIGKEIYGVLFHPEVLQKEIIEGFCDLRN